jgi:hypothetical protein
MSVRSLATSEPIRWLTPTAREDPEQLISLGSADGLAYQAMTTSLAAFVLHWPKARSLPTYPTQNR